MKQQKQVCDVRGSKGIDSALSNEILRVGKETAWNAKIAGNLDLTRVPLNFEVRKGGKITPVDIHSPIQNRIKQNLSERGIKDPNENLNSDQDRRRTVATFIMHGSRERMRELAFGTQEIDYERGANNSHIQRMPAIEQWAIDTYNFLAKKYGEQNIAYFVVHLDETNPHVHCGILPVTEKNKISYNYFFGGSKEEGRKKYLKLHDELFEEVNKKYGLARGEDIRETGAKHKSYQQWMKEQIKEQESVMQSNDTSIQEKKDVLYNLNADIWQLQKKEKSLKTMLSNLEDNKAHLEFAIDELQWELEQGKEETESKLRELKTELQLTEDKIAVRKEQLRTATKELEMIGERKAEMQQQYDELVRLVSEKNPEVMKKVYEDMESLAWKEAGKDAKDIIDDILDELPEEDRSRIKETFDGSTVSIMAEKAAEVVTVASALFLGYLNQATQYASSCGGGGNHPGSGWGRKKDEDDDMFRHRCLFMSINMLRPAGSSKPKKTKKNNLKR